MRMSNAGMDSHAMPQDFLVVTLGADEYAFDVARVLEIRPFEHSPREQRRDGKLPEISTWKGVRASVLDLRIAWGCETPEYDACTAIVLLDAGPRTIGVVVDRVHAVVAMTPEQLRPADDSHWPHCEYLMAVGMHDHRMLSVFDVDKLLALIH